ncbi:MAG: hypothetical protein LAN63_00120 [Acidobacteriia bacterium]|nr:hypothetical protein [Terriglobia bacterium]
MTRLSLLLTCLLIAFLSAALAAAQQSLQTEPCFDEKSASPPPMITSCPAGIPLSPGTFSATPLSDGSATTLYGDADHNIVSLYGSYGNAETSGSALTHFNRGMSLAQNIKPRCPDGSVPPPNTNCQVGNFTQPPAIVVLFIGFSNWDIEIGGGHSDAWSAKGQDPVLLTGQPCATKCPNLNNHNGFNAWNQVRNDTVIQDSVLYQVYSPAMPLVGAHVALFDGAFGGQTLDRWDPTPIGFYSEQIGNPCTFSSSQQIDPECNYNRVKDDLLANGYGEGQVQAIFLKAADPYPQCDLKVLYCPTGSTEADADAYLAETYMGDIVRYLKCCTLDADGHSTGIPRYPNLQQVFINSRIYGGYAVNPPTPPGGTDGCVSPEPFAYETGIAVQRLIVAQINQANGEPPTDYAGDVSYDVAPWVDWAPYLSLG